nr:unnamed protein product [Callosobruchus analis]
MITANTYNSTDTHHYMYQEHTKCQINCDKKCNIIQHRKTSLHQECLKNFANKLKQTTIAESLGLTSGQSEQRKFNPDLCKAMVQSNIPLNKLQSGAFRLAVLMDLSLSCVYLLKTYTLRVFHFDFRHVFIGFIRFYALYRGLGT